MRRALFAAAVLALAGVVVGCSEPEPSPLERARQRDEAFKEAEARRRAREAALLSRPRVGPSDVGGAGGGGGGVGLGGQGGAGSAGTIKRSLLAKYGPYLTPFQRSALLSASISTAADGEELCRKWIEENRRFDEGGGK